MRVKRNWRAHLTPSERRDVREADSELKALRVRITKISRARGKIVNRATNRVKWAANRVRK